MGVPKSVLRGGAIMGEEKDFSKAWGWKAPKSRAKLRLLSWADFPEGFDRFALDPTNVNLETKELSPGVYVLLSSKSGVNNTGFVVGNKGVLVIDAHISVIMGQMIQQGVKQVTSKPILFLVNANYHGDHTFGNCSFPKETLIVQHRRTAEFVPYVEEEKAFLMSSVNNNLKVFEGIELRLPDLVFDDYLQFDLGGLIVETHYFGPANTLGDTITYIPDAKIAFTGNMTGGNIVLALESDAATYLHSLSQFARTLAVDTLIPSHSAPTTGAVLGQELNYLAELNNEVMKAVSAGWTLPETFERLPLREPYLPSPNSPRPSEYYKRLHRYNIMKTFRALLPAK
jgi:cyclase